MTPLRIRLSGFLSYREAQEVRFEGGGVWLLSGANGSGKSAVFDGVTFALFGTHRGGSSNAVELINKECPSASIEFDFGIGPQSYRIHKSVKRAKSGSASSTQQLFAKGGDGWEPVADTTKKVDFDAWIATHIGLTYETFTSSVLLLQGKAEKLLDAKPAARAEVLAGIVDLDRFKRLHERANERKNESKAANELAVAQRDRIPDATEAEWQAAVAAVDEAQAARRVASEGIENLLRAEGQAKAWSDAQTRRAAAEERVRSAEKTLREAVAIEHAHARLVELKVAIPAVSLVVAENRRIADSRDKSKRLAAEAEELRKRKDDAERKLRQAREAKADLKKRHDKDDADLTIARNEEKRLLDLIRQMNQWDEAESELVRLTDEMQSYPADLGDQVNRTAADCDRLTRWRLQLPAVARLLRERAEVPTAERRVAEAAARVGTRKAEGEAAKKRHDEATAAHAGTVKRTAECDAALAAGLALAAKARELVDAVATMGDAAECRACGQPLTAKHLAAETKKRKAEAAKADATAESARTERTAAAAAETAAAESLVAAAAALDDLRNRYKDAVADAKAATAELDRLTASVRQSTAELPAEFQNADEPRLAEWQAEADRLDALKATLRDLRARHEQANRLAGSLEAKRAAIAKLKAALPAIDAIALRQSANDRTATVKALTASVRQGKHDLETAERKADLLAKDVHDIALTQTQIAGKRQLEEQTQAQATQAIDRAMKALSPEWQAVAREAGMEQYSKLERERDGLIAADTEAKFRELGVARTGLDALRQAVERAAADVESYPPEARRDPAELRRDLDAAKNAVTDREAALHAAMRHRADLERHRLDRAAKQKEVEATGERYECDKRLATWLGRDYLQRHLVRTAERQILDHANAVLDRLSGGQLFLDLVTGGDDGDEHAFDMICTNGQTGSKVPVAFLSGGQRFRVAVAIALGIGQYAGKQHRPIESVIIDEGFGSLDRAGRQTVIQELHNLRGLLRCVILVSHQEEFADAFPNGYRFALTDRATTVSRLHG
jgi:exonuclease SbcC